MIRCILIQNHSPRPRMGFWISHFDTSWPWTIQNPKAIQRHPGLRKPVGHISFTSSTQGSTIASYARNHALTGTMTQLGEFCLQVVSGATAIKNQDTWSAMSIFLRTYMTIFNLTLASASAFPSLYCFYQHTSTPSNAPRHQPIPPSSFSSSRCGKSREKAAKNRTFAFISWSHSLARSPRPARAQPVSRAT